MLIIIFTLFRKYQNNSSIFGGMKEVTLTNGMKALVDDSDYQWLSNHKWHANRTYATTYIKGSGAKNQKMISMHRMIMSAIKGQMVDHKDGNPLNNQRCNLRFCSRSQNGANRKISKKFKGVFWSRGWYAKLKKNGKQHYLGRFSNEIDAAKAYNKGAIKFHGEFAKLNDIN